MKRQGWWVKGRTGRREQKHRNRDAGRRGKNGNRGRKGVNSRTHMVCFSKKEGRTNEQSRRVKWATQ